MFEVLNSLCLKHNSYMVSEVDIALKPPGQFGFSKPDEWPKWKKRFQQYRSASGRLDAESEPRQVDTLLYCSGDSVLSSTNISSGNRKKYDRVMEKFDGYFEVRRNIIFERARFNRRSQKDGESVEQYITELYNLTHKLLLESPQLNKPEKVVWSSYRAIQLSLVCSAEDSLTTTCESGCRAL